MFKKYEPTDETIREALKYLPETGEFIWRKTLNSKALKGTHAGSYNSKGYLQIGVGGKNYYAHRIAWFLMTGSWPVEYVDHKNRDTKDNRWSNLRLASNRENQANSAPKNGRKFKGVRRTPNGLNWQARLRSDHLGIFDCEIEAAKAYDAAAAQEFGSFAKLNFPKDNRS